MAEFLAKDNTCGQNLLQIVAVGNAIIAELLRLKDYIPDVFRLEIKEDQIKYAEIILDFKYFKICTVQDKRIEDDENLQELDDGFRETYIEILTRFYLAFESIHQYILDVKNFLHELNDGMYIQQSLESVLQDEEGKQMLTESLYLYGVMLLILDLHIPGIIRERLIVSYYRYSSQKSNVDTKIDDVVKLVCSTGFDNSSTINTNKRVINYPEDYFQRIPIDDHFIEMIIGRLIADDIYNQLKVYPLPEHRTIAIANQASMLFVCLFFSPQTLHRQNSRMREIVDKFFSDNWIISIYMGITVNLINSWEPYKAAKNALTNAIELTNVKYIATKHITLLKELLPKTRQILKEGCLTESMLIKNITKIINLQRNCNVTLRWLLLHTSEHCVMSFCCNNKRSKQIYEQIINESSESGRFESIELFELLLNTGQLEFKLHEILKELLSEKEEKWQKYKFESSDRIKELSDVFSGEKSLMRIEKNTNLCEYFAKIAKEISALNFAEPNVSGRKCIQIIQALEDVQEFHNLDTNMPIKQHLIECRQYLHQMIQIINIKEETLITIQLIGDLSYAWHCIDNFTQIMQENIVNQPNLVIKLRATFLKLASALEIPLLRINQAQSEDLLSVSQYYSNELVKYLRKVIQIIPKTMFEILAKIIHLQTDVISELPTRLEKDKLKEYAQLDERYKVAKLTYSISVFTEGILMMQTTLVGVIELDPKQLLEDGIRKELVKHLTETLHNGLIFNVTNKSSKVSNLAAILSALAKQIDGYRRSFEYVQDYLNIHGCKIWHEEMSRVINYNVEKECNGFLHKKVQDWQSEYQIDSIPIPTFPTTDSNSVNFIGRLAREILKQTDPKTTIYSELRTSWLDYKTHKEIFNLKFFNQITNSIGPVGLVGLDKLYSHMIVSDLKQLLNAMEKNILKEKIWTDMLILMAEKLTPNTIIVEQPNKFYSTFITKCIKIMPTFLDWIVNIGQKQILRKHIAFELNKSCKFDAKNLDATLRTMNDALLMELKLESNKQNPIPTELLVELNKYLQWTGIYNPYHKIYTTTRNSYYYSLFLFLLTIGNVSKLNYVKNISCLTAQKNSNNIDGGPFVIGLATIIKQFHHDIMDFYIQCMCQYILSNVSHSLSAKHEITSESTVAFNFLKMFLRTLGISFSILEKNIPNAILTQFDYLSTKP